MKTTETGERPLTDVVCFDNPPLLGKGNKEELELADEVREQVTLKKPLKSESELESDRIMRTLDAYEKEMEESDGFDVGDYRDKLPPGFTGGMIFPADCSKEELAEDFNGHAQSAIELYNRKMGATFKFVEIEKANCSYMSYHITFTAREDENDEPIVFQASVANTVEGEFVTLCRQKGKPSEGYMEGDEDDEDCSEEDEEDCSEVEEDDEEYCSEAEQEESGQPNSQLKGVCSPEIQKSFKS